MSGICFVFGFKLLVLDQPLCFGVEGTECCISVFSLGVQISEEPEQDGVEGGITLGAVDSVLQLRALVVEKPECKYNSKGKDLHLNMSPPLGRQLMETTRLLPFPLVLQWLRSGFIEATGGSCRTELLCFLWGLPLKSEAAGK